MSDKRKVKRGQVQSRSWWALVRSPRSLPVLFASRKDAIESADPDERLVHVDVCGSTWDDVARLGDNEFRN